MVANQPFKEQIAYKTDLLDDQILQLNSVILGTQFFISFERNKKLMFFAEMILAFFESFLATSYSDVYPTAEKINIRINDIVGKDLYKIISNESSSEFQLHINLEKINGSPKYDLSKILVELSSQVILKNFLIRDTKNYFETLFKKEELLERQSIVFEHLKCIADVFGENPKIFLEDWDTTESFKKHPFKRKERPVLNINNETREKEKNILDPETTKHNQRKVSSVIDNHLWDTALWQAFGFFASKEVSFGILLGFKNGDAGKQIFENWIKKLGREDKNDEIMITVIKGVNKNNPNWYRVHISKEINSDSIKETDLITVASRCHDMFPETNKNLDNLISGYKYFKKYALFPAEFNPNGSINKIYYESGIVKNKIIFKNAWEIGENDIDSVVIRKEDNPIIPSNVLDAPVLGLLKKKNKE